MTRLLYVIAFTGSVLATVTLGDYRIDADQHFILGVIAAFLGLAVSLVAFTLSVQQRNRLTAYLALAFLLLGTGQLTHILMCKGILLRPAGPVESFDFFASLMGQCALSGIILVGIMRALKRPDYWSVSVRYAGLGVLGAVLLVLGLSRIPLPDIFSSNAGGVFHFLALLPVVAYVVCIVAIFKLRAIPQSARELTLARTLIPSLLVLILSQSLLSLSATQYQSIFVLAQVLTMLAYLLALIPLKVTLRRYADYSFQVAGARLTTYFAIILLVLSLFSIVQFTRHEREINQSEEQFLVDLLKKQYRLNQVEFAIQNYMLFADDQYLTGLDSLWSLQQEVIESLRARIGRDEADALNLQFVKMRALVKNLFGIDAPTAISHKVYVAEQLLKTVQQLRMQLNRIVEQESARLPASREIKINDLHEQLGFELGALLALILIVLVVSHRHYRRQIQPVINLNDIAQRIASGQRNIEIITNRKDELGTLGKSLAAMLDHLRTAVDDLELRVAERTAALSYSEKQLRNIMDNVEEGIIAANDLGIIESVNPAAAAIFGYAQHELVGQPIYKLMPEDKREPHIASINQFQGADQSKVMREHRRRETALRKDGSVFPMEINVTDSTNNERRMFIAVLRDITETQNAENALRESERRLSRFFDASMEGLLFHEKGRVIDANNAALTLLERNVLDVVGHNLCDFVLPECKPKLQKMLDSHSPDLWEATLQCGDGSLLPVEIQMRIIAFAGGVTSIAVVRDISERKQAQHALDRHNQFTSRILDIVGSLVLVLNAEGKIVRFNKACEQLTGYLFDQVKGEYIWNVMPDLQDGNTIRQLYGRPVAGDFPNQRRFEWPTKSGEVRAIDWINSAFIADDGSVEFVIAAGMDVTDRLMVEKVLANQLEGLEKKVRERTRELDTMFTLSPDGFVMINEQGQVVYANPAFLTMTGMDPRQVIGIPEQQFCRWLSELCDPQDQEAVPLNVEFLKQNSLLYLKRPTERVISCMVRHIDNEQQSSSAQVLYFRDITHETEVDRMKSEFLSTAAHEFRTPLSSILGFSELLLTGNYDEGKRRNVTEIIHRQSVNMKNLLDELLDLARIDARAGRDFYMTVDTPDNLIMQVIEDMKTLARKNHTLRVQFAGEWPLLAFDADKLRQVLVNVLSNAYKYSPAGGEITCSTVIREHNQQQEFGIQIKDQGIGMAPQELKRVGERFYRADSSGTIPGTGLGMSLVNEIMAIHKGQVEITSARQQGTTVTLWLPVVSRQATARAV